MKAPNHLAFQHCFPRAYQSSYINFGSTFADTAIHEIQTPETTKPLTSLEIRGSVYIEFGGEGVIRNQPTVIFGE
jgi:hypothetical protein